MASKVPIILILGAGSRIGHPVAQLFASKGFRVALVARSLTESDSTDKQLHIVGDFTQPDDIVKAFVKVKKEMGIPSVVLYNAGAATFSPPNDPFAVPLSGFERDLRINTTSVFVAAQQAVLGFAELPAEASKTFLFTGNVLNAMILPGFISQGAGKSATAHMIAAAASAYKDRGFRFYYVDERKTDGTAAFKVDGEAHSKIFWELAEGKTQGPWLQTFVKGEGYRDFSSQFHL